MRIFCLTLFTLSRPAFYVLVALALAGSAHAGVLVDWTFNDLPQGGTVTVGSRLVDSSGNQRDAIAIGDMSVVSGPVLYGGTSAVIFGTDTGQYGEFVPGFDFGDGGPVAGPSFDFDANTSFTVEVIAQFTADDLPHMMVGRSQTAPDTDWWFRKGSGSVGNAAELLTLDDPGNLGYATGSTALAGWHHVAMVRDRASGTLKAYVDGVFDGSGDDLSGDLTNPAWSVVIGQLRDGGNPFNGAIDRIRISDAALLPDDFIQPGSPTFIPGDANKNGIVDATDAAILAANWLQSGGWLEGDFNEDGIVDDKDATLLAANWGAGAAGGNASVPEPSSLILLIGGLLGLVLVARRKR